MKYTYIPRGVCARSISVELSDGIVEEVSFVGGCNGNLQGLSTLVKGRKVQDVIDALSGISCGNKGTSCPDQLVKAIREAVKQPR